MYSDETEKKEYPTEEIPEEAYREAEAYPASAKTEPAQISAYPASAKTEPAQISAYPASAKTEPAQISAYPESAAQSPQSEPTERLTNNYYYEMVKQESTLLKSSLALSNEKCNSLLAEQTKVIQSLIGANNSLVDRLKAMIFAQIGNYQTSTVNAVADSVESNKALVTDMKNCVEKLEKQQNESIAALKKSSEDSINSLKQTVKEVSDKYREMLEKAMSELTETKGELRDELRRQPVTKKETADLLRENIDKTSRDLTTYFEESLSGSVSALNSAIKKASDEAAGIGREDRRGKKLARFSAVATPICLAIVAVIAIVGLFV